jgi:hypothetical protein
VEHFISQQPENLFVTFPASLSVLTKRGPEGTTGKAENLFETKTSDQVEVKRQRQAPNTGVVLENHIYVFIN